MHELLTYFGKHGSWRVRPWREFFTGFKVPELVEKRLLSRFYTNIVFFSGNYLFLIVAAFILQMVTDPLLVLCNFLIAICWIVLYLVSRQGFVFKGKRIESIHFVYLGIFLHLTLLSFCHRLAQFLLTLFLCLICVVLHALLRKRSLRSKIAMRTMKLPIHFDGLENDSLPLIVTQEKSPSLGISNRSQGQETVSGPQVTTDTESD